MGVSVRTPGEADMAGDGKDIDIGLDGCVGHHDDTQMQMNRTVAGTNDGGAGAWMGAERAWAGAARMMGERAWIGAA